MACGWIFTFCKSQLPVSSCPQSLGNNKLSGYWLYHLKLQEVKLTRTKLPPMLEAPVAFRKYKRPSLEPAVGLSTLSYCRNMVDLI